MRLRRGLRVLRRGPDEVQVGTDPRWAVRVGGLSPGALHRLLAGRDPVLDGWVPRPTLDLLSVAGLLLPSDVREAAPPPGAVAEARAAGLLRTDGDAARVLRGRAVACVGVAGLDRVGTHVAVTLAAAGIGTVLLDDDRPVGHDDVGGGVRAQDVGSPRALAVARAVREAAPRTRVTRRGGMPPDVVVTVSDEATEPGTALALMSAEVPHLPVAVRAADCVVGPFVEPGRSPCLRCVELHRTDADPGWPVVLAQLTATRPAARRANLPGAGAPAALAVLTGGLVAAEVLARVDDEVPGTRGAQYEIALPRAVPRRRVWSAHPGCGCADLPV
ncbi:MAG TPA: thiamine biosynthesis protein ThiF [Cellulomonas sp.]